MKYLRIVLIGIAVCAVVAVGAVTQGVFARNFRAGENITIGSGQVMDSSLYAFGQTINISSEVNGDIICAGQNVVISGMVHGDVLCAGQTVVISGEVHGDVRLAGQTVTLDRAVGGNVSVAGQNLTVNQAVEGDLSYAGQNLVLNGQVGRDLALAAESAMINSSVGRNIEARVEKLTFGTMARVPGTIDYVSENDATVAAGASLGQLSRTMPPADQIGKPQVPRLSAMLGGMFFFVLTSVFCALVLALLFPSIFRKISQETDGRFGWALLVGFLASIAFPILAIICFVTIIGVPLGLLALAVWAGLSLVSFSVASYWIGRLVVPKAVNSILVMFTGSLILAVLLLIPIVNVVVGISAYWLGLGSLLLSLQRMTPKMSYTAK